ncbi:chain length determinant protein [Bifidobacterium catenulatum DSM 16992 = JCM 1194 = LMG 11043]|uniref:Chain length determinant protein n=4 Tax=Bifidobacterium catenulatum TaxID=1686 RepID=B6XVL3_9BIFI|nr:chain length determinant protein [Bifidobacterium catenulatum DSM 16992 = JCM 1194 = LMG 11043]
MPSFLGTGHTIILSLGLQENTRSPLPILVGGNGKIAYEMAERFLASGVERSLQCENEREHMTISDVLRAIKKHWIVEIVLFCVVVGVVAGTTFAATPIYTASTEILTQYDSASSSESSTTTNQQQYANGSSLASLYPDLVQSDEILQSVIDNLGLHTTPTALRSNVSAATNDSSPIVYIYATDSNPAQTVRIVKELVKQLKKQVSAMAGPDINVSFATIQAPVEPRVASSPNVQANLAIGIVAGLIIAMLGAVLREMFDKGVNDVSDVQTVVRDPVLASVPKAHTVSNGVPAVITKPRGRAAEEVRRLTTNISFVTPKDLKQQNVIIVTSTNPREGKTTVSVNMAAAFAEKGKSVLLIDADVRHPSVAKALGMNSGVGLVSLLAGEVSAKEAIQPYWKSYLQVLPAEEQKTPSGIILGSDAMRQLVDQAAERYDYVIVDTAPMTVANDAAVFAEKGGVLLLVVGQGVAQKKALREVVKEFRMSKTAIRGVVLNMVSVNNAGRSSYYYHEDHEDAGSSSKRKSKSGISRSKSKH